MKRVLLGKIEIIGCWIVTVSKDSGDKMERFLIESAAIKPYVDSATREDGGSDSVFILWPSRRCTKEDFDELEGLIMEFVEQNCSA